MRVRTITVEREYGSGGALIARRLAEHLGWKLWDEELTAEIARIAKVDHKAARLCDERMDPLIYRLFRVFARGSYERALPVEGVSSRFDADQMVAMLQEVIEDVASRGNCVIVGRGAPYILRNHPDAFHVFIYAPRDEKIRRIKTLGKTEKEAAQLVAEVDAERASFIRHYFGAEWPCRALYNAMINSKFGDEYVIEMILQHVDALEKLHSPQPARV
ncbi:MAG TPA: cytidylate kinase-like family protein [Candidatus Acidoferrales bacterium]